MQGRSRREDVSQCWHLQASRPTDTSFHLEGPRKGSIPDALLTAEAADPSGRDVLGAGLSLWRAVQAGLAQVPISKAWVCPHRATLSPCSLAWTPNLTLQIPGSHLPKWA